MNKLQQLELDMFKKLITILESEQIAFQVSGGTAIGALREKGFIPWDDDIDIGIDINDLDKLIAVIEKSDFKINTKISKQRFPWLKVFDENVIISEEGTKGNLFIDVFLFYGQDKKATKTKKKIDRIQNLIDCKELTYSKIKKTEGAVPAFFAKILGYIFFFKSTTKLWKKMIRIQKKRNALSPRDETIFHYGNKKRETFKLKDSTWVPFEDIFVPVSNGYAQLNAHYYGDIFVQPLEADRLNHKIEILEVHY